MSMSTQETIHSGQFMVSKYDEESDNEDTCDINQLNRIQKAPNMETTPETVSKEIVENSLTKMMTMLTVAMHGQITNPKWNSFKGVKFNARDKIRLNNIIWREYHMQFVKKIKSVVVKFASPLTEGPHQHANVVLEGKYWKRRNEIIVSQYQKWRQYFKTRCLNSQEFCDYFGGLDNLFGYEELYQNYESIRPSIWMSSTTHETNSSNFNFDPSSISSQLPPISSAARDNYEPLFNRIKLQNNNTSSCMTSETISWHSQAGLAPTPLLHHNSTISSTAATLQSQFLVNTSCLMNNSMMGLSGENNGMGASGSNKPRSSSPPPNLSDVFMDLDDHIIMPFNEYGFGGRGTNGEHHCQVIQPQLNNLQPRMESSIDFLNDFIYEAPTNALKNQRNFSSESTIHSYPHYMPQPPIKQHQVHVTTTTTTTVTQTTTINNSSKLSTKQIFKEECINNNNNNLFCKTPNLLSILLQPIQTTTNHNLKQFNNNNNNNNNNSTLIQALQKPNSVPNASITNSPPGPYLRTSLVKNHHNHNTVPNQYTASPQYNTASQQCKSARSSNDSTSQIASLPHSTNYINKSSPPSRSQPTQPPPPLPLPPPPSISSSVSSHHSKYHYQHQHHSSDNTPSKIKELLLFQPVERPLGLQSSSSTSTSSSNKRRYSGPSFDTNNNTMLSNKESVASISNTRKSAQYPHALPSSATTTSTNSVVQHYIDELSDLLLSQQSSPSSDTNYHQHSHNFTNHSQNTNKVSKAALLQKAAETIKRLRNEKHRLIDEINGLQNEIDMLQGQFSVFCSKLPPNGVCITTGNTKPSESKRWFDEFILSQSQSNWKFYIFYMLFENLFTTYDSSVSTQTIDGMVHEVASWLEKECSLIKLRHTVINGMRTLSRKTSIVQHPQRLSEEISEMMKQHQVKLSSIITSTTAATTNHNNNNNSNNNIQSSFLSKSLTSSISQNVTPFLSFNNHDYHSKSHNMYTPGGI